jgi:hypothetical protein
MSLPLHLRTYQEPTKEDLARTFFNLPPIDALYPPTSVASPSDNDSVSELRVPVLVKQYTQSSARSVSSSANGKDGNPAAAALYSIQSMEVNAVLSVEGKDEVYVSSDVDNQPYYLATSSLTWSLSSRPHRSQDDSHSFRRSSPTSRSTRNQLGSAYRCTPSGGSRGLSCREFRDVHNRADKLMRVFRSTSQAELSSWRVRAIVADMARSSYRKYQSHRSRSTVS